MENNDTYNLDDVIIGMLLVDNTLIDPTIECSLVPDSFTNVKAGIVYKAILEMTDLIKSGNISKIDMLLIIEYLDKHYNTEFDKYELASYISDITHTIPSTVNFRYFLNKLKNKNINELFRDEFQFVYGQLAKLDNTSSPDVYLRLIDKLTDLKTTILSKTESRGYNLKQLSTKLKSKLSLYKTKPSIFTEFKTGILELDKIAQFKRGILTILWSFTGMGKTTLTMNLAISWAMKNLNVIIFALEQNALDIYKLLVSIYGGWNRGLWEDKSSIDLLDDEKFNITLDNLNKFTTIKVIDDPYITVSEMLMESRKHKADVVIIDNMNNITVDKKYREQEYSQLSIDLNAYAIDSDSLVILIQQANAAVQRPNSIDGLSYSKSTSKPSSVVLGIYCPSEDKFYDGKNTDGLDDIMKSNNLDTNQVMYIYNCKGRTTGIGETVILYDAPTGKIGSIRNLSKFKFSGCSNEF